MRPFDAAAERHAAETGPPRPKWSQICDEAPGGESPGDEAQEARVDGGRSPGSGRAGRRGDEGAGGPRHGRRRRRATRAQEAPGGAGAGGAGRRSAQAPACDCRAGRLLDRRGETGDVVEHLRAAAGASSHSSRVQFAAVRAVVVSRPRAAARRTARPRTITEISRLRLNERMSMLLDPITDDLVVDREVLGVQHRRRPVEEDAHPRPQQRLVVGALRVVDHELVADLRDEQLHLEPRAAPPW